MGIFDFLSSKDSLLKQAIDNGDQVKIIKLIDRGANKNIKTDTGKTALELAVEKENLKLLELLLARKVDLEIPFQDGNTALMAALKKKNETIASLLVDEGANINMKSSDGHSPLIQSILNSFFNFSVKLINKGADIKQKYESSSIIWLVLSDYSKDQSNKLINILVEKGIDLDQESNDGFTELMYAIDQGDDELVQLLLDREADVNYYSENSKSTPLSIAIVHGNLPIMQKLIQHKVDINYEKKNLSSAISLAIEKSNNEILKLLLKNGAEIKTKPNGNSYLQDAIMSDNANVEIIKILVENGADVNEGYDNSFLGFTQTPLMFALDRKRVQIAEFLIKNGGDLHFESNGITPLTYAIKLENEQILSCLLAKNILPKANDYFNAAKLSTREEVENGDLMFKSYSDKMPYFLTRAISLNPNYGEAYGYRGVYYCAELGYRQNPELISKSLTDLNKAIQLGCTNPLFFFSRGVANDESGNIDAAISDFSIYLKSYPKGSGAYNNRGLLYKIKGNYLAAEKDFTMKITLDKYGTAGYLNRSGLYFATNRENEGAKDCEAGLKIDPDQPTLVKNLGLYHYNQIAEKPHLASVPLIKQAMTLLRKSMDMGDEQARGWYNALKNRYNYEPD